MITIYDNDEPIEAAKKIIYGTVENPTILRHDVYNLAQIREIAQYLLIFCNSREGETE